MSALDGILMLTTFLISILVSPADVKRPPPTITSFGCGGKGVSGGGAPQAPDPNGAPTSPDTPHSDDSDHPFRRTDHRFRRIPITLGDPSLPTRARHERRKRLE